MDFKKGHIPLNKGLKGHFSKEICLKMSKNRRGKCCGDANPSKRPEVREKIRQSSLGKKMSDEARRKMSLAKKGKPSPKKGIKSSKTPWNKGLKGLPSNWKGKHHTEKTKALLKQKRALQIMPTGENHCGWKGGSKAAKSRRRALGHVPLNEYFEGSEPHHIDREHVIFIPYELHHSLWHSLNKPESMIEINRLAFDYLKKENGKI